MNGLTSAHLETFWRYVDKTPTCWNWNGYIAPTGYGRWRIPRSIADRRELAHRVSYAAQVGPLLPGMQIDHLCNNRRCVNPAHLEQVTQRENLRRGKERRTHCGNGHQWTEESTYVNPNTGQRACRPCIATYRIARAERGAA